eukprot:TRINITY_DN52133_c0_g1_i1.p1 TRINITY_DN52133_c0_g1~~TRINITY_DN52133_c0_g1_i1.p1  ORF type:complete len:299 (-),score=35.70 TRINITY_DN52133_c0_g1_i1:173-1069(-)
MHQEKCADFRLGRCSRGDSCKYVHEGASVPGHSQPSVGVEECGDFKNGKCSRGATCKFSHDIGNRTAYLPLPPQSLTAPTLQGPFLDPGSGRYYYYNASTGQSEWAPTQLTMQSPQMMPFAGLFAAQQAAAFQAAAYPLGAVPTVDTRELCGDFKSGKCSRGASCKFSHGPAAAVGSAALFGGAIPGLVPPHVIPSLPVMPVLDTRNPCGDFRLGKCMRGASCKFSHGTALLGAPAPGGGEECADFKRNQCNRGDQCKFLHTSRIECGDFKRGCCLRDDCKYAHVESRHRSRSRDSRY